MTIRANTVRPVAAVSHRKERVRERGSKPIGSQGCVARRAGGCYDPDRGGIRGEVIRDSPAERRCALPLGGVATVAIRWRHSGAGVAKGASRCDVRTGQRKAGGAVVKDRAQPRGRGVARVACLWIAKGHVVWNRPADGGGALIKGIVAAVASRGQRSGKVIGMALRAGNSCQMRPGQREGCGAVIESGSRPIRRRVANRTVCREPGGNMIRYRSAHCRGALPSSQMAAIAGSRTQ
jgi:hypothetical protein